MDVIAAMLAKLRADAELTSILVGGIFDQPLNPDDPITGQAWQPNPDTGVKRLRPAAVMLIPQEVNHPLALNPERRIDVDLWPELVFYAERGDMADTFDAADQRAMELLHRQRVGTADIAATGYRARPIDADELPGDVWTTLRRYRVQAVRHIQEA